MMMMMMMMIKVVIFNLCIIYYHPSIPPTILRSISYSCRVSPDQKREVVDMIKVGVPGVRTLGE